jgi:hypothetical protein
MIGRIIGGVIGGALTRQTRSNPVAGAVIGAGAMFVARRLFPARYAALAATAAAAYATKKWAERSERNALHPNTPVAPGVVEPTGVNTPPTAPAVPKD